MRNGDLSGAINANGTLQQIYDPLTGNADGTGRAPFVGNAIPADRISPVAQKILGYYPLPNLPGNTRNYVRDADSAVDRNNYDVKLNWNRTSVAPALGQVQPDGRRREQPVLPGRRRRRHRRHRGQAVHAGPDLDAQLEHRARQHVRLLASEPGSAGVGLRAGQLRRRHAGHSRAPTARPPMPTTRGMPASRRSTPASAPSATTPAGTRCSATSARTRFRRTSPR